MTLHLLLPTYRMSYSFFGCLTIMFLVKRVISVFKKSGTNAIHEHFVLQSRKIIYLGFSENLEITILYTHRGQFPG
jgi:hypothetical protein